MPLRRVSLRVAALLAGYHVLAIVHTYADHYYTVFFGMFALAYTASQLWSADVELIGRVHSRAGPRSRAARSASISPRRQARFQHVKKR